MKGVFTCEMKIGKRETKAEFTVVAGQGKTAIRERDTYKAAATDVKAEGRGNVPQSYSQWWVNSTPNRSGCISTTTWNP